MADGTGVLLHLDTKFYYTLNAVGVSVWQRVSDETGATLSELTEHVHADFDVDAARAEADIAELMAELTEEKLVASEA